MTQPKTVSKFTPGPWSLFKMYGGWSLKGAKGEAHRIAAIMGTRKTDDDPSEALANARLIAQAPEMYELLSLINAYHVRILQDPSNLESALDGYPNASDIYRDARRIKAEIDGVE